MSRIDDLIAKHCPDGVPFYPMWRLTTWDKKFNAVDSYKQPRIEKYRYLLAKELSPLIVGGGDVKILTTNESDLWANEESIDGPIHEAEIVAIPWGGNAIVQHYSGRFVTSDNRIAVANDPTKLDMRFLYYFMTNNLGELASFYRGSGIKHPSMAKVLDWLIPVPPLEVQRAIVEVLDTFSKLEAELEAELEARKQQYAHYRYEALSFPENVSWVSLSDVVEYTNGKAHEKLADPDGNVAMVTARFISRNGEANRFLKLGDVLTPAMVGDVAMVLSDLPNGRALARTFYVDRNDAYAINQRVARLRVKNPGLTNPRFVHYFLDRNPGLLRYDNGFDQTHLSKSQVTGLPFPAVPLHEQNRIVAILDKFDALVNDLSIGLPAELSARRQQYEYYRDRLLTFKELEVAA